MVIEKRSKTNDLLLLKVSDRRGSNPRSRPWQGRALPTTPLSHLQCVWVVWLTTNNILSEFMELVNKILINFPKFIKKSGACWLRTLTIHVLFSICGRILRRGIICCFFSILCSRIICCFFSIILFSLNGCDFAFVSGDGA